MSVTGSQTVAIPLIISYLSFEVSSPYATCRGVPAGNVENLPGRSHPDEALALLEVGERSAALDAEQRLGREVRRQTVEDAVAPEHRVLAALDADVGDLSRRVQVRGEFAGTTRAGDPVRRAVDDEDAPPRQLARPVAGPDPGRERP